MTSDVSQSAGHNPARDHGGGLDAAIARFGGTRDSWLDLSTGINPEPYPVPAMPDDAWTALPDQAAMHALEQAARRCWNVPDAAGLVIAPGASSLIARLPGLWPAGRVHIPTPTYNEHGASFAAHGWKIDDARPDCRVLVHPNNPTGGWARSDDLECARLVIDESFADVNPSRSLMAQCLLDDRIILKSFGKFWGLAGARLGFAIGSKVLTDRLSEMLGPWPVSGPALAIGTTALGDIGWARATRARLERDSARLDAMMERCGATASGGTSLFRLYSVDNAAQWQNRLAKHHIWTRIFPYSEHYLRLGLPGNGGWNRLGVAL